jgi:uncharacterized protein (DUF488 family)
MTKAKNSVSVQNSEPAELKELIDATVKLWRKYHLTYDQAGLIDIRFAPTTGKQVEWRKDYLRLLLKDRYLHVPHLGNRISKGSGRHSIQNLSLGIKIITELRMNLLLMCECLRFEDCHRSLISQKLKEQGIETEEIIEWNTKQ